MIMITLNDEVKTFKLFNFEYIFRHKTTSPIIKEIDRNTQIPLNKQMCINLYMFDLYSD